MAQADGVNMESTHHCDDSESNLIGINIFNVCGGVCLRNPNTKLSFTNIVWHIISVCNSINVMCMFGIELTVTRIKNELRLCLYD